MSDSSPTHILKPSHPHHQLDELRRQWNGSSLALKEGEQLRTTVHLEGYATIERLTLSEYGDVEDDLVTLYDDDVDRLERTVLLITRLAALCATEGGHNE